MGLRKLRSSRSFRWKKDKKAARAGEDAPPLPERSLSDDTTLTLPALRPPSPLLRPTSTLRLLGSGNPTTSIASSGSYRAFRRSRSFSQLTCPTSSTFGSSLAASTSSALSTSQPWRSHEAWRALHQETVSPSKDTEWAVPSVSSQGGWRSRAAAAGGFFGSEVVERRTAVPREVTEEECTDDRKDRSSTTSSFDSSVPSSLTSVSSSKAACNFGLGQKSKVQTRVEDSPTPPLSTCGSRETSPIIQSPRPNWTPGPATLFLRQISYSASQSETDDLSPLSLAGRTKTKADRWLTELDKPAPIHSVHSILAESGEEFCSSQKDTVLRTISAGHSSPDHAQVRMPPSLPDDEDETGARQIRVRIPETGEWSPDTQLTESINKLGLLTRSPTPDALFLTYPKTGQHRYAEAVPSLLPPLLPEVERARMDRQRQASVTSMRDEGDVPGPGAGVPWGKRSPFVIAPPTAPSSCSTDIRSRPGLPSSPSAPALATTTHRHPLVFPRSTSLRTTPPSPFTTQGPGEVLNTDPKEIMSRRMRSMRLLQGDRSPMGDWTVLEQTERLPSARLDKGRFAPGGWV